MATGMLYVLSILVLTVVVAVVYSAAQEAFAPPRTVARQALKRGGKLAAVLLGLMLLVQLLSSL